MSQQAVNSRLASIQPRSNQGRVPLSTAMLYALTEKRHPAKQQLAIAVCGFGLHLQ